MLRVYEGCYVGAIIIIIIFIIPGEVAGRRAGTCEEMAVAANERGIDGGAHSAAASTHRLPIAYTSLLRFSIFLLSCLLPR